MTAGWCGARWGRGRRGSSGSRRSARLRRSWPARRRGRAPAAPEESTIGVRQTTLRVSGPGTLARGVVPVIPSGNQDVRKPVESGCFRTVSKSAAKGRFRGKSAWGPGGKPLFRFSSSLALFSKHLSRPPLIAPPPTVLSELLESGSGLQNVDVIVYTVIRWLVAGIAWCVRKKMEEVMFDLAGHLIEAAFGLDSFNNCSPPPRQGLRGGMTPNPY